MIQKSFKIVLAAGLLLLFMPMNAAGSKADSPASGGTEIRLKPMPEGVRKVYLVHDPQPAWRVLRLDGSEELLSPKDFTQILDQSAAGQSQLLHLLNISSRAGIAWVLLGLLGQVLFTGRMVAQWLTSERARRSVVPVAFWWMSLSGATMLLIYFIWRRDIVGILGQSAGWFIYSRNLRLIYRKAH